MLSKWRPLNKDDASQSFHRDGSPAAHDKSPLLGMFPDRIRRGEARATHELRNRSKAAAGSRRAAAIAALFIKVTFLSQLHFVWNAPFWGRSSKTRRGERRSNVDQSCVMYNVILIVSLLIVKEQYFVI